MAVPTILVPHYSFSSHASVSLHLNFGSADEGPEQRGQAHMLEHLLVRTHFSESLALKATTGRERTSFQVVTEASQVRRAAEELMGVVYRRVDIPGVLLAEEKGIIAREIAERRLTKSWRAREATFSALWEGTPYSHDPLGHVSDWEHISESAIRATLEQYYQPNNAVLVVVGDPRVTRHFEPAEYPPSIEPVVGSDPLPHNPRHIRLRWGHEELGHVFAWADCEAMPRARLANRLGKARFQQLALRAGWLTWVWVPPGMNPHRVVEQQLADAISALSATNSPLLGEHKLAEIKRSERVEARAADAVESLWVSDSATSPVTLKEGLDDWRSLARRAG